MADRKPWEINRQTRVVVHKSERINREFSNGAYQAAGNFATEYTEYPPEQGPEVWGGDPAWRCSECGQNDYFCQCVVDF